jgi:hypothetical protein
MKFGFDMQNMNERRDIVILVLLESAETGLSKDTTFIDLMHGVKKLCLSWRFLMRNFDFPEIEQTFGFYDIQKQLKSASALTRARNLLQNPPRPGVRNITKRPWIP